MLVTSEVKEKTAKLDKILQPYNIRNNITDSTLWSKQWDNLYDHVFAADHWEYDFTESTKIFLNKEV